MDNSQLLGKKIFITGASGFIGTHLCSRLYGSGAEVYAISRTNRSTDENDLQWFQGDLADIESVRHILNKIKPDLIYHLAGHVKSARDLSYVIPTFRDNLISTVNILTVASEIGCDRIIHAGSLEEPESGNIEDIPSSPYAISKWACNAYARMFNALYQLPVINARIFMVYGPGQHDLTKLVPYVITSLLSGETIKFTSGQRPVDWIYIDDVIDGLLVMANAPNVEGKTIDLGSGKLISIRSVVQKIIDSIDSQATPLFGKLPDRPMEQIRVANMEETYDRIGWIPKTSLDDGLKFTVEWYKRGLSFMIGTYLLFDSFIPFAISSLDSPFFL